MRRRLRRLLLLGVGVSVLAAAVALPASARRDDPDRAVAEWIDHNAAPLATTDPTAPLDDLRALHHIVGGATVVGLGESTHGSHEQFQVKQRLARFLVERKGFHTVAMEEDFAGGVLLDRYVTTGEGDPRALAADMSYAVLGGTKELVDLLQWMRGYNQTHRDQVRFLGTDVIALRQLSFDEVTAYVRRVAPGRLDELERDLGPVRMRGDRFEHMAWYFERSDGEKRRLVEHARRVVRFVDGLPAAGPRLEREFAERHARAIAGWYESFAREGQLGGPRETFVADTVTWWQRTVGGKVAYWAANVHSTAAPSLTLRLPGEVQTGTLAGGYLRERLGRRYLSIGLAFTSGVIRSDFTRPAPHPVGPPPPGLLDAQLARARTPNYLLDLRMRAPEAVRAWLEGPATMRMIHPSYAEDDDGAGHTMEVGSLLGAFDVLVNIRTTTPTRPLT
jgi:erythromycin esterase